MIKKNNHNNFSSWFGKWFSLPGYHRHLEISGCFGKLEAEIMEIIWCNDQSTVREVCNKLKKQKAYTTVMTVLDRLHNKGILDRKKIDGGAYAYFPSQTKAEFESQISKKIIQSLIAEFGDVAVAQFFDVIESQQSKNLKEWQIKLKTILKTKS